MTGPAKTERHGLVCRAYGVVRLPPPVDDPPFFWPGTGRLLLGAWGLTATHLTRWLLIAIGLLTSEVLVLGVSLLSFAATSCLAAGTAASRLARAPPPDEPNPATRTGPLMV